MEGFFSAAAARAVRPLPTLVANCGRCGMAASPNCRSPKMRVDGEGRRGVMIASDYPGKDEDSAGRPFVGGAGRFLAAELSALGVDLRRDCWLTNAQICYDADKRAPKTATEDCRPNLLRAVAAHNPRVILLLGGVAVHSLLSHLWKADVGKPARWWGVRIPAQKPNAWICPSYNPAHVVRGGKGDRDDPLVLGAFRAHLAAAMALPGRPWDPAPPDYAARVEVVTAPDAAAARLRRITAGTIAWDIETTTLKPDGPHAEIVCCSVCWEGRETFAFPWHGAAVPAMLELLQNPDVGKIGYNCFSGDTKFLTRERGVVAFRDVVGEEVTVLNHCGRWVRGRVGYFGVQETVEVSFARRNYVNTVRATDGHEWVSAEDGPRITTVNLKRNRYRNRGNDGPHLVPYLCAPKVITDESEYCAGVRHGVVLGDGSRGKKNKKTGSVNFYIRLCGAKRELLPYFDGFTVSYPPSYDGDPAVYVTKQFVDLKALPPDRCSDSYLIGFARGLLATDGCVNHAGQISICGSPAIVSWCYTHLPRIGFWFQNITDLSKYYGRYPSTGFNTKQVCWDLSISRESVSPEDLLREAHRRKFHPIDRGPFRFSSRGERRREAVFCVVVPDGNSFTLDGGLVTGNCKFETRWARRLYGVDVRGWVWDGMLAAHLLDPRRGVTGLKYQAFVRLGQPDYNSHVAPFLDSGKEAGGNAPNRIWEIDLHNVLKYCGLDSLLEYEVAQVQMREMGL